MTTAHHLRLIDGMCTREFPAERTPSGSGVSGPGYHTVFLHTDEEPWGDEESVRAEHRAQCLAEHDALLTLLASRWGEPQLVSVWSAQERMTAGEVIPEPWVEPVAGCDYLRLWRNAGRWVAVGLVLEEGGPGCELTVLVTVIDPP
ncbi:hypothetical protein CIB93_29745 [Streptomyces sp. WZ.A104]|uniref:hypothetical protein n=1 Tax=Streptomyces sp. WZ.A104 TaxID=2023771 RepID=UPI000BBC7BEC|nr:hypothetical protein [Streptomyces sp. WZ.A104]PCG82483.1 hypothetical protein CIB93_29745 [Streptomyces sp. WZ.A104]